MIKFPYLSFFSNFSQNCLIIRKNKNAESGKIIEEKELSIRAIVSTVNTMANDFNENWYQYKLNTFYMFEKLKIGDTIVYNNLEYDVLSCYDTYSDNNQVYRYIAGNNKSEGYKEIWHEPV